MAEIFVAGVGAIGLVTLYRQLLEFGAGMKTGTVENYA